MALGSGGDSLVSQHFDVPLGDTDAAGVVYFGTAFRWAERLVTAWLGRAGLPLRQMIDRGEGLPPVHAEADYRSPLRLGDHVEGHLWLERHSRRSVTFRSEFSTVGLTQPAVEVRTTHAWIATVDGRMQAIDLPEAFVQALHP